MKLYQYIFPGFIFCCSLVLNFLGINWGLPNKIRTDLVFPKIYRTDEFYNLMKETREEIYKLTGDSPVGFLREGDTALAPIKKHLGLKTADETLNFIGENNILANFIRPYLLRSHDTDEQMVIAALSKIKLKKFDFDPHLYHYGGAYLYTLGGLFLVEKILGILHLTPDIVFYLKNPEEIAKIFIAGRAVSAISISLSAIVIFFLAKKIYNITTAFIAVILFCLSPAVIIQAHTLKPFALATLFSLIGFYFSSKLLDNNQTKYYLISGVFLGLAIGSIYTYWSVIFLPLVFHYITTHRVVERKIIFLLLTTIATFIITNPYWILNFQEAYFELSLGKGAYPLNISINMLKFFICTIQLGLGTGTALLFIGGILYILLKREKVGNALLVSIFIPYLFYSCLLGNVSNSVVTTRFVLPWLALMTLLAGRLIEILLKKSSFVVLPLLPFLLYSINYSFSYTRNYYLDTTDYSTRLSAGRWISENIPSGSSIGLLDMPQPSLVPPFDFSKYKISIFNINQLPAALKQNPPEFFITRELKDYSFLNDYYIIKEFNPVAQFFGKIKYNQITHTNSPVKIFKKI